MRVLIAPLLLILLLAPARAQQSEGAAPPYDADMMHLAEVMGALHYLRPLCGARDGDRWRAQMQSLMDAEQPSDARRSRLVASFNRGYSSYEQVYRMCTSSARLASARYLEEGAKLARDIATRYGSN